MITIENTKQGAKAWLDSIKVNFKVTRKADRCPDWAGKPMKSMRKNDCPECGGVHGDRYLVLFSRKTKRFLVSFWNSQNDKDKGLSPDPYDVLACISTDWNCPDTFDEFCNEFGYDNDSIKALRAFKATKSQSERMNRFFSQEELEQLSQFS